MKIGVVTLHRVRNFGSLLQTYATNKTLSELNNGNEVTFIDYFPKGLWLSTGIKTIKGGGNILKRIIRKAGATYLFSKGQKMVNKFLKKNVTCTKKRYLNYGELENEKFDFDAFVCGSDQIWNTQNANEKDDVKGYYLEFVPEGKLRVAYSSSIGKDSFEIEEAKEVKSYLSKFSAISVREDKAKEMLSGLNVESTHVVDPTLMLKKEDWKEFGDRKKFKIKGDYIFVYNLNRNPEIVKTALTLSKETNLPIINFADTFQNIKGAKNKTSNTPFDFVNYILNAKYVLTDSFHATAFSLNLNKDFVTFKAPKFNSRLESILRLTGQMERLTENSEEALEIIKNPLDKERVNLALDNARNKTKDFLENALKEKNDEETL